MLSVVRAVGFAPNQNAEQNYLSLYCFHKLRVLRLQIEIHMSVMSWEIDE